MREDLFQGIRTSMGLDKIKALLKIGHINHNMRDNPMNNRGVFQCSPEKEKRAKEYEAY
jgi:hypothetical protein